MPSFSFKHAGILLATGLSLSACETYGGYGYGGGYGGYGGYGGGYGSGLTLSYNTGNYYGWNDGYYYPGTGYYVYDTYRRPHRWNNVQQQYWVGRQSAWRSHNRGSMRSYWGDYRRRR